MSDEITQPRDDLFIVGRTISPSHFYENDSPPPCEYAFPIKIVARDERSTDSPDKVSFYKGESDWWYSHGSNHRIENGHIVRDVGYAMYWAVEVANILAFVEKYGQIVLSKRNDGFAQIEIYDDYRE